MFFPQDFSPIFGFGRKKHLAFFWAGEFVFPASTRFYRGKKNMGMRDQEGDEETKKVMKILGLPGE